VQAMNSVSKGDALPLWPTVVWLIAWTVAQAMASISSIQMEMAPMHHSPLIAI
jgi:hypothetical protein